MNIIKTISRNFVFPLIHSLGLEKLFSASTSNNCLVVNYHGVVKNFDPNLSRNHISIDQFVQHMEYFHRHFDVISLSEAFRYYSEGIRPQKQSIAITFDDGYENNLTHAVPVLNRFNFPATVFVTARTIFQPATALWYDQLDLLRSKFDFNTVKHQLQDFYPAIKQMNSYNELKEHFKNTNSEEKETSLGLINGISGFKEAIFSCDQEYWKMLDELKLKELSLKEGIEIGSHAYSHSNLDRLDETNLAFELNESKSVLEKLTGKKVDSIAYPDGAYNQTVKRKSLEAGYRRLLAVNYHLPGDKNDATILPRLSISNTTTFESVMIAVHRAFRNKGF